MVNILFVCLGNICRSPAAEAVFNAMIKKNGLEARVQCDSAGTAAYHVGEPADYRMRQFANNRGYQCTSISRQVNPKHDFEHFDYIMAMDRQNLNDLKAMARNESDRRKLFLMTDYADSGKYNSVPDPYYGGDAGFELVLDILEESCSGLIKKLQEK